MKRFLFLACLLVMSPACSWADPATPIEVQCGGQFKPVAKAVKGKSGPAVIQQLYGPANRLLLVSVPWAQSGGYLIYNQFCNAGDQALTTQCKNQHQQAAIDNAIDECKKAALASGMDDTQYRCKRETCPAGAPAEACTKHATNATCSVLVPQLQCKCGVKKQFDQPTLPVSTVSCMCECECTASGQAEMQCKNCDGGCVTPGSN